MLLSNNNILLRALEPADLDILYKWENDTSLWSVGTTIAPFSRKQLWDYIENYDNDIYSARQLRLMIVDKPTGTPVGTIDICDFDPANGRMGIGILVDPAHCHCGYGSGALRLVMEYAHSMLNLHQLYAYIPAHNRHSIGLFKKCGFQSSGRLRSWLRQNGTYSDVFIVQHLFP